MEKKGVEAVRKLAAPLLCLCLLLSGCGQPSADAPLGGGISNPGEVAAGIRSALGGHARSITVSFDYGGDIFDGLDAMLGAWVEAALAETDAPTEGDYIRCQLGGYTSTCSRWPAGGGWHYTVELVPDYYCYAAQEAAASEAAEALLKGFGFTRSTGDYEKLRTIYGFLCANVTYDMVHRKNPYYQLKSTAYAALVQHTATCQGFCAALYRLLRGSGISCRIVTGTAEGEEALHAWVIAELDGLYYNLDPTWDAGQEEYRYFLLGSADFTDHIPGEEFLTGEFTGRYPMAYGSFPQPSPPRARD